jgi:nucleoid-associated protein YgaU
MKRKPEESAKTAETGRTEKSASDRVSVKVTPPPGGLSLPRSEEIGSPGFDPVPSPLAGKRADPLVSLDPKTPTKPDPPFTATRSDLRDFSKSKRLDPKETGPARTDPEVVISPFVTAISRGRSPFDRPVRSPGGRTPTPVPGTRTSGAFPKTHTVVRGDTYWDIAELYYGSGVQCKTIQKANGSKLLVPGMKLKVPAPPRPVVKETKPAAPVARLGKRALTPTAPQAGTKSTGASGKTAGAKSAVKSKDGRYYIHTVRAGETLTDLAKRYYNSPRSFDVIEEANPRLTYETLRVNQKIRIPVR